MSRKPASRIQPMPHRLAAAKVALAWLLRLSGVRLRSPCRIPIWGPRRTDPNDHRVWVRLRLCAPPLPRARIARIDALATLLDSALVIPGTGVRFGLDALIGLVPAVGDIVTATLSLFIVHEAYQLGVPGHIILRMLERRLDGAFGAVPVVGDAFDVLWRANRRNMRLLRNGWSGRSGAVLGHDRHLSGLRSV